MLVYFSFVNTQNSVSYGFLVKFKFLFQLMKMFCSHLVSVMLLVFVNGNNLAAEYEEPRPHYGDHRGEPSVAMDAMATPQPAPPVANHPEAPLDAAAQGGSAARVLALSQRQHEIILKAAQELKFIRLITLDLFCLWVIVNG